jgi:hypothetical protein
MIREFYQPHEFNNLVQLGKTEFEAVDGNTYKYLVTLNDNLCVVERWGEEPKIVSRVDFFYRPTTQKEKIQEWWSEKFGKNLTDETYAVLNRLFSGGGVEIDELLF